MSASRNIFNLPAQHPWGAAQLLAHFGGDICGGDLTLPLIDKESLVSLRSLTIRRGVFKPSSSSIPKNYPKDLALILLGDSRRHYGDKVTGAAIDDRYSLDRKTSRVNTKIKSETLRIITTETRQTQLRIERRVEGSHEEQNLKDDIKTYLGLSLGAMEVFIRLDGQNRMSLIVKMINPREYGVTINGEKDFYHWVATLHLKGAQGLFTENDIVLISSHDKDPKNAKDVYTVSGYEINPQSRKVENTPSLFAKTNGQWAQFRISYGPKNNPTEYYLKGLAHSLLESLFLGYRRDKIPLQLR